MVTVPYKLLWLAVLARSTGGCPFDKSGRRLTGCPGLEDLSGDCPSCLDRLVGYWPFDKMESDSIISSDDGSVVVRGSSPSYVGNEAVITGDDNMDPLVPGRFGSALGVLEKKKNWAQVSLSGLLQIGPSIGFAGSIWIQPEGTSLTDGVIWERMFNSFELFSRSVDNTVTCRVSDKTGFLPEVSYSVTFNASDWIHVACSYSPDNRTLALYVNGEERSNETVVFEGLAFSHGDFQPLGIGNRAGIPHFPSIFAGRSNFRGAIDDFALWNKALTSDEVYRLYSSGKPLQFQGITTPSASPSAAPTQTVSNNPTIAPTPLQLISSEKSSELVIIPNPPLPAASRLAAGDQRSDCPHLGIDLLNWHTESTWTDAGMPLPSAGSAVSLPPNSKILVIKNIFGTLGIVTIPSSSQLIFGENPLGVQIDAAGFQVDGKLIAGSETCSLETPLDIVLHGSRPADINTNPQAEHSKGIAVTGTLELHGKRFYRTWTRLSKGANAGDAFLYLQHPINWEQGQEIVLVTTAVKDSREWHQNEVLTVDSVESSPHNTLYLTSPLQYDHIANSNYQAEVGLLSRVIRVMGATEDSLPTDPDPLNCTGSFFHGNNSMPCLDEELLGFGGHIILYGGGLGHVEGVELYQMGQTNVIKRYPMNFHSLGDGCQDCYIRDSSIHRSFYHGVSIQGTNQLTISENVAYDVIGSCFQLMDGVEEDNTFSYNLVALLHMISEIASSPNQIINAVQASADLPIPTDTAASGFLITNVHNNLIGNAVSGGFSGYNFPVLLRSIGEHKDLKYISGRTSLVIDGNTAHSTSWWYASGGGMYFGGVVYYTGDVLNYEAGRVNQYRFNPCKKFLSASHERRQICKVYNFDWVRITNTKVFLTPATAIKAWSGRFEVVGLEAHDVQNSVHINFNLNWMDRMLIVCRTGEDWVMPVGSHANEIRADGFEWYQSGMEHILTNTTFRNCGYRSDDYEDIYDNSPTRGCGDSPLNGCRTNSAVFAFPNSDSFLPDIMVGTKGVTFEECGNRFTYRRDPITELTESHLLQNWIDADGSISGLGEPSLIATGVNETGLWWNADPDVVRDTQTPLIFMKQNGGPSRGLGHIRLSWESLPGCGSTACPVHGQMRHFGPMFAPPEIGLPVTSNGFVNGLVGGFGWWLDLEKGAPRTLTIKRVEVDPDKPLLLKIVYPLGTSFNITAKSSPACKVTVNWECEEIYTKVDSVAEIISSDANTYHVDGNGMLTVRLIMTPEAFTGSPNWSFWNYDSPGKFNLGNSIDRWERGGVRLPRWNTQSFIVIEADCAAGTAERAAFCNDPPPDIVPQVCSPEFEQISYDRCCHTGKPWMCETINMASLIIPADVPSTFPSVSPSNVPTEAPKPSSQPSLSLIPTHQYWPSSQPTLETQNPSTMPSPLPSIHPTSQPSITHIPTSLPSEQPSKATHECPAPGAAPYILPPGDVMIAVSPANELCTLNKLTIINGKESISPAARSLEGQGWEPVAGKYLLPIECQSSKCVVALPPLSESDVFQLTSFDMSNPLSEHELASRFLERTTFGPTRTEIAAWATGPAFETSFPDWVSAQMSAPLTSHREYFRTRAQTRLMGADGLGAPIHPCQNGSRWNRAAFTPKDKKATVVITGTGPFLFEIDGEPRTVTETFEVVTYGHIGAGTYVICDVTGDAVGSGFILVLDNGKCKRVIGGNPPIRFDSERPSRVFENLDKAGFGAVGTVGGALLLEVDLTDALCDLIPRAGDWPVYVEFGVGDWWVFDPRIALLQNTVDDFPSDGGGTATLYGVECANVPKTFLNIDSCIVSNETSTCSPFSPIVESFPLNEANIRTIYSVTNKFVYALDGLRPSDSPCVPLERSRWLNITGDACTNSAVLDDATVMNLTALLRDSEDVNPLLRDIQFPEGAFCDTVTTAPSGNADRGIKILVDTTCFEHVHPDHLGVYDMTYWTLLDTHPGNMDANGNPIDPNPIKKWAENGDAKLVFPSWHPMTRWDTHKTDFTYIGRLGDDKNFQSLPEDLRFQQLATDLGIFTETNKGVVCGSPGEVKNDPSIEPKYQMSIFLNPDDISGDDAGRQKKWVWTMVTLFANDQLRQKVAWALSQIFALAPAQLNVFVSESEVYMQYYDIFVRQAFGNYRDIMKEVSFSPMMAEMLSFLNSKSSEFAWQTEGIRAFADENYAREIMQLFSIGLVQLNRDGTPKLDPETGETIETYDNDDIMTFARAWSGFGMQNARGNMEDYHGKNRMDPMSLVSYWRDPFPKMGLGDNYIGDTFALCTDFPERAFLRKGAKYRYLGSSTEPELQIEGYSHSLMKRFKLDPDNSDLQKTLCNASTPGGECNFQVEVVLEENLACYGNECSVDTVRVVQADINNHYEYVRLPCVEFPFYENAKKVRNRWDTKNMCGDPLLPLASNACCSPPNPMGNRTCEYTGERVTYDTSVDRCLAMGQVSCEFRFLRESAPFECELWRGMFWEPLSCEIFVKVDADGKVAIVHKPTGGTNDDVYTQVRNDTMNFFKVNWEGGIYPSKANCCGDDACEAIGDGCLCPTSLLESSVFDSPPSDVGAILSHLHIGSPNPHMFDPLELNDPVEHVDFIVHSKKNDILYDKDTVFELTTPHGNKKFLKNAESRVKIQKGNNQTFSFRNPPQFMSIVYDDNKFINGRVAFIDARDALYETDVVLDEYFYHPNLAPFLASRMIQRLGTSNPAPSYVLSVANAFNTGKYEWISSSDPTNKQTFGSGIYGDIGAMVAAVVLHVDALSPLANINPSSGSLKEPLLKLVGFMRAMEFEASSKGKVAMFDVHTKIGQMVYNIPSVFSFFEVDFVPPGVISAASLVSPEAQAYSTPNIIGLLNGLFSMIKYGLNGCHGGFGRYDEVIPCDDFIEGDYSNSDGILTFTPSAFDADAVVDELALLLTPGRLSEKRREIIKSAYDTAGGGLAGLRLAQQLFLTTPEFHSTNTVPMNDESRDAIDPPSKKGSDYKAVVVLYLEGGVDGFNVLVPLSECHGKDLNAEYKEVRGKLAMSAEEMLPIDATSSSQPCDTFGVHKNLPVVQKLYNDTELAFLANIGLLFEPVTRSNWAKRTKTKLFAHNTQVRESQQVDPFQEIAGTGVMGRMADMLTRKGLQTGSFTMSDISAALVGKEGESPKFSGIGKDGVQQFDPASSTSNMQSLIDSLNGKTNVTSGMFGETWSELLHQSLIENDFLHDALRTAELNTSFRETDLGAQLMNAAKLISSRTERGTDRDFFVTHIRGFDTHASLNATLRSKFTEVNNAIEDFVAEMKHQGQFDNVLTIMITEFGRTLTPNNSEGSDHAWGNNLFLFGGGVDGGRIFGEYPNDLTASGPLNIGRGSLIPTTSFVGVWNGIAEWTGILGDPRLDEVLPHRVNFDNLITKGDLFK